MSNINITIDWIRNRFDLQYNNANSNRAPGIIDEELSIYLTMAHIEIIDSLSSNPDVFEKNRSMISSYIKTEQLSGTQSTAYMRGYGVQVFNMSNDYFRIINEYAYTQSNQLGFSIKPSQYDGINTIFENPKKSPNGQRGLRIDLDANGGEREVKLIFKKMNPSDYIVKYDVTYIIQPNAFIIESDYIPETIGNNLFLIEKIINRAVELATRDYKENTLQTQIQTNTRSE